MNKKLRVDHYNPQSKLRMPVLAVANVIIKERPPSKDFYEVTFELDEDCLDKLGHYINEVLEYPLPVTPKDLGFFLQGILSNIVNFQEHPQPRPCAYIAGQKILTGRKYRD